MSGASQLRTQAAACFSAGSTAGAGVWFTQDTARNWRQAHRDPVKNKNAAPINQDGILVAGAGDPPRNPTENLLIKGSLCKFAGVIPLCAAAVLAFNCAQS